MTISCSKSVIKKASAIAQQAGIKKARTSDQMNLALAITKHQGALPPANNAHAKLIIEQFAGFHPIANDPEALSAAVVRSLPGWIKLRYMALVRHGSKCQCCGASPSTGAVLHVDHIKPVSRFPELALDIDNLQILCESCNSGKSAWDETDWR